MSDRLESMIGSLGNDHEPPFGWQARVLAAVHAKPRRRWWHVALPASSFALLAALVLFLAVRPHGRAALPLTISAQHVGGAVRGSKEQPLLGDHIAATATGNLHLAVWIYHDNHELVIACPGRAGCRREARSVTADVVLSSLGTYRVIALSSNSPLPAPIGSYDESVAAAIASGATVHEETQIVR